MTQRSTLELPIEVLVRREDVIDDARQLERDQRARDPDRFLAGLGFEESTDLRVVLDGADAGVTERELEVAIARLRARAMPRAPGGVVGAGNEAAVGEELFGRGEAFDAIDLGVDGKRVDLADAGNPEQALDVVIRDEVGMESAFYSRDLIREQRDLRFMTGSLQAVGLVQLGEACDVELLEQAFDAVLCTGTLLDQAQAGMRSARRSSARTSESTLSVLTLAAEMALSRVACASRRSTCRSPRRSASQYQLPVDSTTARCGPVNWAK